MFMEVAWSAAAPVRVVSASLQEEPAPAVIESISLPPRILCQCCQELYKVFDSPNSWD